MGRCRRNTGRKPGPRSPLVEEETTYNKAFRTEYGRADRINRPDSSDSKGHPFGGDTRQTALLRLASDDFRRGTHGFGAGKLRRNTGRMPGQQGKSIEVELSTDRVFQTHRQRRGRSLADRGYDAIHQKHYFCTHVGKLFLQQWQTISATSWTLANYIDSWTFCATYCQCPVDTCKLFLRTRYPRTLHQNESVDCAPFGNSKRRQIGLRAYLNDTRDCRHVFIQTATTSIFLRCAHVVKTVLALKQHSMDGRTGAVQIRVKLDAKSAGPHSTSSTRTLALGRKRRIHATGTKSTGGLRVTQFLIFIFQGTYLVSLLYLRRFRIACLARLGQSRSLGRGCFDSHAGTVQTT